jgi:hypothetical protein
VKILDCEGLFTSLLVLLMALPVVAIDTGIEQARDRTGCLVTQAPTPAFVPPSPFPSQPTAGRFYVGTAKLWALPFRDWAGVGLKTEKGYRVKFPWFANDIGQEDVREADLSIGGRRLDGAAPSLIVEGPHVGTIPEYQFFTSALIFPAGGCWEITAERKGTHLKFVVSVSQ